MPAYLGQASIVLDQTGLPPGTPGRSRNTGVAGVIVNARNNDNTNILRWRWSLARPRASAATLSSTQGPTTTFTPDVDGTYALTLTVNEGKAVQQRQVLLFAVKNAAGKRFPAQGETTEANWNSAYTGQPNETGWWEDIDEILRANQAVINGSIVTAIPEAGLANSRELAVGPGLSLVDGGPGSTLTLNTAFTAGTELHADVVGQPESIVGTRTVDGPSHNVANYGQTNLGSEGLPGYGTSGNFATIAGGYNNKATAQAATVGGGLLNVASAANAVVAGGTANEATAAAAAVLGGSGNIASGAAAAVAGGTGNSAQDANTFVGAGATCLAVAPRSAVVAGNGNQATGDDAFVGAGVSNLADGAGACIVAGNNNETQTTYAFVGAGDNNTVSATHACIVAGTSNAAGGDYSGILCGSNNLTGAANAAVAGGSDNSANAAQAFVGAGTSNVAAGIDSAVAGGNANNASGNYSSIPGGRSNTASAEDAHAWGRQATASHTGSIVIKDGANVAAASSAANEITLYGSGNIRLMTNGAKIVHRLGTSSNNYKDLLQGHQTTTNNSTQHVTIASPVDGADVTVRGTLKGKQASSANGISLAYWATFTRNGGAVALVGSPHWNDLQTAMAWTASVNISGSTVRISFTGAAGVTIRWSWDFEVHYGGQT